MSDLFTEKAKEWDKNEMVLQLSNAVSYAILESIKFNDQMKIMDFGAGTGLITSQVAPHVASITAVDISQSMLSKLAEKINLKNKVKTVCQDILKKPLEQKFDVIVSAMAMHHVKDTELLIQRFAQHLKTGAKIALADLDAEDGSFHPTDIEGVYHDGFNRDNLKNLIEKMALKTLTLLLLILLLKKLKVTRFFL